MLELNSNKYFIKKIEESSNYVPNYFYSKEFKKIAEKKQAHYWQKSPYWLSNSWYSENTVSIFIDNENGSILYKNYKKDNNKWQLVTLDDVLLINNESYNKINQLLINEIGKLKGVDIDCSAPHKHLENVKDKFFITDKGISFEINKDKEIYITLSWDSLRPFLR